MYHVPLWTSHCVRCGEHLRTKGKDKEHSKSSLPVSLPFQVSLFLAGESKQNQHFMGHAHLSKKWPSMGGNHSSVTESVVWPTIWGARATGAGFLEGCQPWYTRSR